ncbi:serine/threonine-protein kinase KIN2 [Ceratobasidium sp. 395]|nr:serine/threonine-protein kinase KIN2 [Ceratobasidium sp. 395]
MPALHTKIQPGLSNSPIGSPKQHASLQEVLSHPWMTRCSGPTRRTSYPARTLYRLLARPVRHPGDDRLRIGTHDQIHARLFRILTIEGYRSALERWRQLQAGEGGRSLGLGMGNNGTSTTLSVPSTSTTTLEPTTSKFRSKMSSGLDFCLTKLLTNAYPPTHARPSGHNPSSRTIGPDSRFPSTYFDLLSRSETHTGVWTWPFPEFAAKLGQGIVRGDWDGEWQCGRKHERRGSLGMVWAGGGTTREELVRPEAAGDGEAKEKIGEGEKEREESTPVDVKPVYLKELLSSVVTTSTKPARIIKADAKRVLDGMQVQYHEIRGGFECTHVPSIDLVSLIDSSANANNNEGREEAPRSSLVKKGSRLSFGRRDPLRV